MAGRPRTLVRRLEEVEKLLRDAKSRIFAIANKLNVNDSNRTTEMDDLTRAWGEAMNDAWRARRAVGVLLKRLREKHGLPPVEDGEVELYVEWKIRKARLDAGEDMDALDAEDGVFDEPGEDGDGDEVQTGDEDKRDETNS